MTYRTVRGLAEVSTLPAGTVLYDPQSRVHYLLVYSVDAHDPMSDLYPRLLAFGTETVTTIGETEFEVIHQSTPRYIN